MGAVESDSVKSAKKAKDKAVKERQKLVSKLCMGRNKTNYAHGKHERVTRQ